MTIAAQIQALPNVRKLAPFGDRLYVNLDGMDFGSTGDRTRKIWIKGNVVTIERGKGCVSGKFSNSFAEFLAGLRAISSTDQDFSEARSVATYAIN